MKKVAMAFLLAVDIFAIGATVYSIKAHGFNSVFSIFFLALIIFLSGILILSIYVYKKEKEEQKTKEISGTEREKQRAVEQEWAKQQADREKRQQEEHKRLQKEQAELEPQKEKVKQILLEQKNLSDTTKWNAVAILGALSTKPITVKEINTVCGTEFEEPNITEAIRYIERIGVPIVKSKKVEEIVRVKDGIQWKDQTPKTAYALYKDFKSVIFTYIDIEPNKSFTIDDIDLMDGKEFEEYIAKLFTNMGYITEITKASNDQGIDVIAKKDGTSIGIQAKRYSGTVGNSAVQEAIGGKAMYKVDKIMVITNNEFTSSAKRLAEVNDVVLWDRTILKDKVRQYSA